MDKPQCLLYAAAMVLDEDPKVLIKEIGHNGLDIWWPELKDSSRYRGFHIQEIIDLCLTRQKCLVPIDIFGRSAPSGHPQGWKLVPGIDKERFENHIDGAIGILIGETHSAAWNGYEVYDPNGVIYSIDSFQVQECWLLI